MDRAGNRKRSYNQNSHSGDSSSRHKPQRVAQSETQEVGATGPVVAADERLWTVVAVFVLGNVFDLRTKGLG